MDGVNVEKRRGRTVKQLPWGSGGLGADPAITSKATGQQQPGTVPSAVTALCGVSEGTGGIVTSVPHCQPGRDSAHGGGGQLLNQGPSLDTSFRGLS